MHIYGLCGQVLSQQAVFTRCYYKYDQFRDYRLRKNKSKTVIRQLKKSRRVYFKV